MSLVDSAKLSSYAVLVSEEETKKEPNKIINFTLPQMKRKTTPTSSEKEFNEKVS